tara:strand:- start:1035 stop:2081 length:1047 start_codon:yes stop_codon:yes gene_type:complete
MNFLAGDLGGTKIILAIYESKKSNEPIYKKRFISKEWDSFNNILINFFEDIPSNINPPKVGCIAVAGPVLNGKVNLTNLNWSFSEQSIKKRFLLKEFSLINDFACVIYGIPFLHHNQYEVIHKGKQTKNLEKISLHAVIGAGTGLGISKGLISKTKIYPFPSEGGHTDFSPKTNNEWDLLNWLKKDLNLERISKERIISGPGLSNIARWKLEKKDCQNHPLKVLLSHYSSEQEIARKFPAEVSKWAENGDQAMKEVIELWLSAYGSIAGDLAIHELSYGGIWIFGGTASKHLSGLKSEFFLKSYKNKGRLKFITESIPIRVIVDEEVGLFSASCRAKMLLKETKQFED